MTTEITREPGRPTTDMTLHTVESIPAVLDLTALCELFGCSRSVAYRAMAAGDLPRPVKFGGSKRWLGVDIAAVLARKSGTMNTDDAEVAA